MAVIPIAIFMLAIMVGFVGATIDTSRGSVSDLDTFRARAAAQSVASMTIADIWGDYDAAAGGTMQLWTLRAHLDGMGLFDQSAAAEITMTSYLERLGLAQNVDGRPVVGDVEIERVALHRLDEWDSTSLVIEVEAVTRSGNNGSSRERRSAVQETFTITPPQWEGLDFALLATNVNCLLCHTTIDTVDRVYNQDQSLFGTFDQVRVGSLESIHFRDDPDSQVAGTLLIGGDAIMGDGDSITDWSLFNLDTAEKLDGKLIEDVFGNLTYGDLNVYDHANPDPNASLFLDFYSYGEDTDYELPESFPSPFPDNGGFDFDTLTARPDLAGNRIVDDTEFASATRGARGTISGGSISVVPKGDQITTEADRLALISGTSTSLDPITDGNVYMHGTEANPIILDGDVAVDGDVIISGVVKGQGVLRARGNVFVAGDLIYADGASTGSGERTYGFSSDGTENNLAIAAGANIVVGDFYRPAWGEGAPTDGTSASSFNFTMEELAIFNRMEWMKTQPTLPGERVRIQVGTNIVTYPERVREYYQEEVTNWIWVPTGNMIEKPVYEWQNVSNGLPGEYEVITRVRVQIGTRLVPEEERVADGTRMRTRSRWVETGEMLTREEPVYEWQTPEHPNPYYNSLHLPRYYAFSDGSSVPVFNKAGYFDPATGHWKSEERAGSWDTSKLTIATPGDTTDPLLYNSDGTPKAVVSTIAPTADWIDPALLRGIIAAEMADQPDGDQQVEIDATLYSANSILGTIPDRNSPDTNGKLLVNGGIVAADVGILAPSGTQVNFDIRGAQALSIAADNGLTVDRRYSAPVLAY
ncbi:MAG: hypothetical protein AAF726_18245 [Planctomycetota bacterium]